MGQAQISENREFARNKALELFGRGPALLSQALKSCPRKMWLFRSPSIRSSIHDVVLRLADSEAQVYVQCRQFISEPGSEVSMYDATAGASTLGYFHQSTKDGLSLIVRLRSTTYKLLCSIPDSVWTHTARDARYGVLSLEGWLSIQARYIPRQIELIQLAYADWARTARYRRRATSECLLPNCNV